jgi:hypothetical protein
LGPVHTYCDMFRRSAIVARLREMEQNSMDMLSSPAVLRTVGEATFMWLLLRGCQQSDGRGFLLGHPGVIVRTVGPSSELEETSQKC